jgi:glycosyltransferase involved in cell wall biosynthesis
MESSTLKPITAVILTYNEALHIERCIRSLKPIAEKIFVVDSFSTDNTVELARSLGADVVQRPWRNYADQFQWGLDHCQAETEWVMRIDGNEYLETDLQLELQSLLPSLSKDILGVYLKLKVLYDDKWIRYGGFYPLILMRIWRTGKGRIEQRWMDEHMVLAPGAQKVIAQGHLVDDNRKGITFWIDKHNKYASREAVDLLNRKYPLLEYDEALKAIDDPQAKRKRLLKENVYARLPIGLRAGLYFFYRYFLKLGVLDGGKGFIWHFMQGFWYRLLVDIKVMEIEARSGGNVGKMKEILLQEHGLKV